jgi:serine protease Do
MKTSTKLWILAATSLFGLLAGLWGAQLRRPESAARQAAMTTESAGDPQLEPSTAAEASSESISASRQNAITRAAARVGPAVVAVSVVQTRVVAAQPAFDDFFSRFFLPRYYREQVRSIGSGVVVSADGYILTNEHVTGDADSIWVTLEDGRTLPAHLVGSDRETDLAVLKVSEQGLPAARLGNSDSLLIGEWALALGNPFGYLLDDPKPSVTVGVISAVDRDLKHSPDDERVYRKVIQTDAAINPGNSGGPLVNSMGEVVGINSFIFSSSRGSEGIGFAIPINQAKVVIKDLVTWGEVRPAWVGVKLRSGATGRPGVDPEQRGVVVQAVAPGSPADSGGLMPQDRILRAGRKPIKSLADWEGVAYYWRAGDRVTLSVDRGAERVEVALMLAERPLDRASPVEVGLGLRVVDLSPAIAAQLDVEPGEGVVVSSVMAGSQAARAGLARGDIIRRVNRVAIEGPADLDSALDRPTRHVLTLEREGQLYLVALEP